MTGPRVIVRQKRGLREPPRDLHAYHLGFMPAYDLQLGMIHLGQDGPRALLLDTTGANRDWFNAAIAAILDAWRAQAAAGAGHHGAAS